MKLSKLAKTFKSFLSWDKEKIEENAVEINAVIKKLYDKKEDIEVKLEKCTSRSDEKKLEDKLKAVKKLIKKAKKEFI